MNSRKLLIRILAWITLAIITVILFFIAYAMVRQNGRLAFAMIFLLVFVSVILYFILKINKNIEKKIKERENILEKENLLKNASMNTKKL